MNQIWSKDYENGDFWSRADVAIFASQPFQIVLEAVVGDGYAGDIAIDDVSFTEGCILSNVNLVTVTTPKPITTTPNQCAQNGQFMCLENNQCIDQKKVCDFKVDCPTPGGSDEAECGTCTFDKNNASSCGWKDSSYSSIQWFLLSGGTNLGPSGDHTTGNGFYFIVLPSDTFGFGSLRSPTVGPTGDECQLKLWYYMNFDLNTEYSQVAVYMRDEDDDFNSFVYIDAFNDPTGPQWKQGTINIGRKTNRFVIGM